jgi:hypothetical protein
MSQPNSPPPFDPIAQQAAAFADTLDRTGTVHVETPKPASAMARGTSSDEAPEDSAWPASVDPLCDSVDARDNAAVVRDPEIGHEPPNVVVGNSPPQPVEHTLEREPFDPNAGHVDHVDATAHLKGRQPSTDRYAGVSFDPTRDAR